MNDSPHRASAFETVKHYFNTAADQLKLDPSARKLLMLPKREITVEVPVELDDGTLETYVGFRVQHNNARGPMNCLLYTSPSPRDATLSRMPSSA